MEHTVSLMHRIRSGYESSIDCTYLQLIRGLGWAWILGSITRALDIYSVPQRAPRLIKNKNLRPQTRIHVTRTAIFILTPRNARAINSNKQHARRRKREIFARHCRNRGKFHTTPCYFYLHSRTQAKLFPFTHTPLGRIVSSRVQFSRASRKHGSNAVEICPLAGAPDPVSFSGVYLQRGDKVGDFRVSV